MGQDQTSAHSTAKPARTIPASLLIATLAFWLGGAQLLLWRFLDVLPPVAYVAGLTLLAALCIPLARLRLPGIPPATLLLCFLVALALMILGGEGRFLYANIDWQVRFAVLRDLTASPWPFVYTDRGTPDLLRAPIAMFLIPALAGKAGGPAVADMAMLLQNSALLALILALGSLLFETRRTRLTALAVVIMFSGLDALGRLLFRGGLSDHIENWAFLQFSSYINLAFWVPNHALSGWIGALFTLLWRRNLIPLGSFLALLPLTALWSPLGLIGAMPFAALAAARALAARQIRWPDIALPAAATLLSLPGLLYLAAAPDAVGTRITAQVPFQWAMFELLEVLVYAIPLALAWRSNRFGVDTLALLTLCLLALPFVQIGWSTDLMMRGSIAALAILAVMTADAVARPGRVRWWLVAMLLIGSITGLTEIRRAFAWPPAPQVQCSFPQAWDQSFSDFPKGSWLAPLSQVPAVIRPENPAPVSPGATPCWQGHWHSPDD